MLPERAEVQDPNLQAQVKRLDDVCQEIANYRIQVWFREDFPDNTAEDFPLSDTIIARCSYVITKGADWRHLQLRDPIIGIALKWKEKHLGWYRREKKGAVLGQALADALEPSLQEMLGKLADTTEGKSMILVRDRLQVHQGKLYLKSKQCVNGMPQLLYVVPHETRCLALCFLHEDAGHQGRDWTLSLLSECLWWPSYVEDVKNLLKDCDRCKKV